MIERVRKRVEEVRPGLLMKPGEKGAERPFIGSMGGKTTPQRKISPAEAVITAGRARDREAAALF